MVQNNAENTAVKKTVKKKAVLKVNKPKGATGRVCELLMERKYTDEQIVELIQKEYTDRTEKQIKVYCQVQRADINSGRKPSYKVPKDQKLERFVDDVDGKVIPYSTAPHKTSRKKKENKERKLLKKHTNIPVETVDKKDLKEV